MEFGFYCTAEGKGFILLRQLVLEQGNNGWG